MRAGMLDLDEALRYVVEKEGSDLHLKVPSRPLVRIHGRLEAIEHYEPLMPAEAERVLRQMLGGHQEKLNEFDAEGEVDFAYSVESLGRFRINAFRQRGSVSIVARSIPLSVKSLDELRLPTVLHDVAD